MSEQQPKLSADGLYYWDGRQWVTTLSADGRSRWDGSRWVPVQHQQIAPPAMYAPVPYPIAQKPSRVPTDWTRPLQYAVAGLFAIYALYSILASFLLAGAMDDYMRQTALRQAQLSPQVYPDPNQYADLMAGMMNVFFVIGVIIVFAVATVVIIGALKRWVWLFYVVLVLLGFTVLGLPFQIANVAGLLPQAGVALPATSSWAAIAFGLIATALGAWMLIALITRGPWAMRRPLSGGQ